MNATAIGTATRAIGLALVIVLAAASGLVVGNALQARADGNAGPNLGGLVPDNPGGTVVNARAANTSFSLEAIEAIQAIRDRAAAPADYLDYGQRHPAGDATERRATAPGIDDFLDYGLRHPESDADADAAKKTLAKPTLR